VTAASINTPIIAQVYCSYWPDSACLQHSIDTLHGKTNDSRWWISVDHDMSTQDGNISLTVKSPTTGPQVKSPVSILSGGIDPTILVKAVVSTRPLEVEIDLKTTNPEDTSSWMIYNPASKITPPSPFYKVRFIGSSGWAGKGQTGNVVESNASVRKIKKMEW
jgi:hypothetical protein